MDPQMQAEREAAAEHDAGAPDPKPGGEDGNGGNGNGGGQTIDQLADGQGTEDDGQEFFVIENGQRVSLSSLYKRNTPVEYEFKLSGKSIKGGADMGLIAFSDPDRTLIVPGRAGKVETDPTYNPDGTVKKVTIRQHFKSATAYDSRTKAGQVALRGE